MDTATTSLAPANSMRAEWSHFLKFLRRPVLPPRAPMPNRESLRAVVRMFVLDLLAMALLLAVVGLVMAVGFEVPETALAGMEIGGGIVFAVVIAAPIAEEILFRGWLSGRPGHILAVAAILAGFAIAAVVATSGGAGIAGSGIWTIAALIVALGFALVSPWILRRRNALGWFSRLFPVMFWLSTLMFACVHLLNFELDNLVFALPLVLPQFVTGSILGYLRVKYGLWASMALHLVHNAAFIGMVLLSAQAAG